MDASRERILEPRSLESVTMLLQICVQCRPKPAEYFCISFDYLIMFLVVIVVSPDENIFSLSRITLVYELITCYSFIQSSYILIIPVVISFAIIRVSYIVIISVFLCFNYHNWSSTYFSLRFSISLQLFNYI